MTKQDTQTLPITQAQADLLVAANQAVTAAQERLDLVSMVILAGHGLTRGRLLTVDTDQDPPVLTVATE